MISRGGTVATTTIEGACAAAQMQEAVGQDAAFEEGIELVFHELRQVGSSGGFGLCEAVRGMLLHPAGR